MADFDELLEEAKKRDMYILMDLVINHCSDQHEWFRKALEDPEGEYGNYFYFEKGKNGKAPSNYRSYFGGSVWEPVPGTDLYYLHLFAKEQPDLNWENKKVREELFQMVNWWLEKGGRVLLANREGIQVQNGELVLPSCGTAVLELEN